ncbi:hypothetical protein AB6A40_006578 [Gnathostoma spinigerum]|uniref:C3H1-type domain-containing protein n=1 Tax=Gnathostoma spinigerum TaxID=75299 RepID=A0ABD6ENZ0_9BILA
MSSYSRKGITTISSINAVVPSGENNVSSASSSAVAINSSLNSQIPCRFGNKCANAKCMFKHPKLCRFGAFCTNPTCYFWHPSTSTPTIGGIEKAKYKWKASTAV